MPLLNFESISISDRQVTVFRRVLRDLWEETLEKKKPREWNAALLRVTEGRQSRYDPKTKHRTFFYSWCGDWVTYHLERAGCLHKCLNRESIHGKWHPGKNLSLLRVWAGDTQTASWSPKYVKALFENDASAGDAWHPWDDKADACKDGYEPQLGDLVLTPRKNGDHIEFWVSRKDKILTVSAGAQTGGVAAVRTRDLDLASVLGIIDVSRLAPSTPY
jgi:hypothetical protein